MVAALLDAGGLDPTVVNGGIINAYGANAKVGEGEWIVVEADESDGTFLKLPRTVAVVTNIDPEHLDHYGDFATLKDTFRAFVQDIPFYGFAAVCIDDPDVQDMAAKIENRRLITYGTNPQADLRAMDIVMGPEGAVFDVRIQAPGAPAGRLNAVTLPMVGRHNVLNALAAIAVARELGVPEDAIRAGLAGFRRRAPAVHDRGRGERGANHRRLRPPSRRDRERPRGRARGDRWRGHRGGSAASLFAVCAISSRSFCRCFNDAETVIVANVYAAGEAPIAGVDRDALALGLRRHGHRRVLTLDDPASLPTLIAAEAAPGDLVVFLGAGDITTWAHALPAGLSALAPLP